MERRTSDTIHADLNEIHDRLKGHCERMDRMEQILVKNTEMTAEVVEILDSGKAAFNLLRNVGNFAKWVGGIATAIVGVWALIHLGPEK